MNQLDADVTPLYSKALNKYCQRDIVQFVPFRSCSKDPVKLAREVLAEVPKQMTQYFGQKKIRPMPKKMDDKAALVIRNKMRNQVAQMMGVNNSFAGSQRHLAIEACKNMGFDPYAVTNFVDNVGMAEENINWVLNYMNDPNYRNVLRDV